MRNSKRLNQVRSLPCVKCGNPESQAAHSNFAKHGKGRGIKASDEFTIPLCVGCHQWLDQYHSMSRYESKAWFEQMLIKTNRMLSIEDREVF
ncbi:DUF968 domain-containing protein [Acinetobacter silvestris]|uniref:DUF968 domain-containing protein n=1 Tax=Acinetobacter silvestris TaxID=1977882 RepID=A0A1Y3CIU0_9GAMM|nr:DUF968 domain-containing protein [Acinetobacter silvestris]OTG65823.1 hypothetical protein B9T28_06380 [Acinetobacter silvestris]